MMQILNNQLEDRPTVTHVLVKTGHAKSNAKLAPFKIQDMLIMKFLPRNFPKGSWAA